MIKKHHSSTNKRYIDYKAGLAAPTHKEGRLFYDDTNKTLGFYNNETDVTLQIGQEMWIRVKNNTGSTITNGQVVYITGDDARVPTVELASATVEITAVTTIGIATHDIETGTIGIIATTGAVRGIDTSAYSAGDNIWLSTTAGAYQATRPQSPYWSIYLGQVGVSDASEGTLIVHINIGTNNREVLKFFNGSILEDHTFDVTSNGTTITATLEKTGGGDLNLLFDAAFTEFDSTPAASVGLDDGTDTVPKLNYVFIEKGSSILQANITGFPATQHVRVGTVVCQSAATAQTEGIRKVHAWTDHLDTTVGQGHLSHLNQWIRQQHATWLTGGVLTTIPAIGATNATVDLSWTAGTALQLHSHDFPAFDTATGDDIHIVNHPTTPYLTVTDFETILVDSAGGDLTNRYFTMVFWTIVSEDAEDCHIMCNLPSGSYGNVTDATNDTLKYSNFTIPSDFKGASFLSYSVLFKHSSAGNHKVEKVNDLRGFLPNQEAGASSAAASTFPDNAFAVYDDADNTKRVALQASGITTGTTRTLTVPNADGTIALTSGIPVKATATEINTGTDDAKFVTSLGFKDSRRNIRWLVFNLVEAATDCAAATNIAGDFVSPIAGTILQSDTTPFYLYATNSTAGTTGNMVVDISIGGTSIMTTNKLKFDTGEKTTTTASTPPDLTTTSLAVGNIITIDIDSIHTTAAKGLTVYMAIRES